MSVGNGLKIAVLVFLVSIMQVSAFSSIRIDGAAPDLLLVTLVSVALLRGSITGAVTGFLAGLVVDVATLGTLGLTSLLLTLAGYWAGRYGETTGRDPRRRGRHLIGEGPFAVSGSVSAPRSRR